MKPTLFFAALAVLLASGPASAQKAAGQLETAEGQPDLAYENSPNRKSPVQAADGRGSGTRPNLKFTPSEPKEETTVPRVGEDRAVTKPLEKPSWFDSKWTVLGACGLLGALFGFLAAGPWGLLGGLLAGAAAGYVLPKLF